jgi:hypothetical protein
VLPDRFCRAVALTGGQVADCVAADSVWLARISIRQFARSDLPFRNPPGIDNLLGGKRALQYLSGAGRGSFISIHSILSSQDRNRAADREIQIAVALMTAISTSPFEFSVYADPIVSRQSGTQCLGFL